MNRWQHEQDQRREAAQRRRNREIDGQEFVAGGDNMGSPGVVIRADPEMPKAWMDKRHDNMEAEGLTARRLLKRLVNMQ